MKDSAHGNTTLPSAALIGVPFLVVPWLLTLAGLEFPISILVAIACLVSRAVVGGVSFVLFRRRRFSLKHRMALYVCFGYLGIVAIILWHVSSADPEIEFESNSANTALDPTGSFGGSDLQR